MVFFTVLLLVGAFGIPLSTPQSADQTIHTSLGTIDGQILFAPMDSTTTYLIDRNGTVNHTWPSAYLPGEGVWWMGDGTILRTIKDDLSGHGGTGGGIQEIQWDGTLLWDYRCNTNGNLSHHDAKSLPNGDVLLIVWETKTRDEAIAVGRNPDHLLGDTFIPDKIIEVKPTGPTRGTVVWEWHVWDHLIQDYDSSKANYGVVGDHPELVDINYGSLAWVTDWMHTNSVDYNQSFDQIMISVHNFNEIWVIDHSTTSEEAAGHTGGRSGKGGDLLYRWGNPLAYQRGASSDQKLFFQHDATWIKSGCPGAGGILIFNNGFNRPDGYYSTVDEITPPVNNDGEYYLAPGAAYGPPTETWTYIANPPTSFYSSFLSGAQRISNGDTLICNGEHGKFFEVTPQGDTIWEYTNPYPIPPTNRVFKIVFIPTPEPPTPQVPVLHCQGSLSWTDVQPGATVHGSFQVQNVGDTGSLLNWSINTSSITWGTWSFDPEHGENLKPEDGSLTVNVTVIAPNEKKADFEGYVRVENKQDPNNFEVIPVSLVTPANSNMYHLPWLQQLFIQFLQRHPYIEKIWTIFTHWHLPLSH
jgi:hypothetical protein